MKLCEPWRVQAVRWLLTSIFQGSSLHPALNSETKPGQDMPPVHPYPLPCPALRVMREDLPWCSLYKQQARHWEDSNCIKLHSESVEPEQTSGFLTLSPVFFLHTRNCWCICSTHNPPFCSRLKQRPHPSSQANSSKCHHQRGREPGVQFLYQSGVIFCVTPRDAVSPCSTQDHGHLDSG